MYLFNMPITNAADDILKFSLFFKLFFGENNAWYFMWIVCLADNSDDMPSLIFSQKMEEKKNENIFSYNFAWRFKD